MQLFYYSESILLLSGFIKLVSFKERYLSSAATCICIHFWSLQRNKKTKEFNEKTIPLTLQSASHFFSTHGGGAITTIFSFSIPISWWERVKCCIVYNSFNKLQWMSNNLYTKTSKKRLQTVFVISLEMTFCWYYMYI